MAALIRNILRQNKLHKRSLNMAPAKAGTLFFTGAYVVRGAASGLCIPGSDLANVVPLGVAVEPLFPTDPDRAETAHLDNTNGPDGVITSNPEVIERAVRYDMAGEYSFTVSAGTPLVGGPAYLVDDNTVSATATANSIIAGHFTRPAPDGGWFIDISRRGIS